MTDDGLFVFDLHKQFNEIKALDGVNLELSRGKIVGLLGQNGAGKSTLVRLLSGVMEPTNGTARMGSYDLISDTNRIKRITGLLPEEYALYEKLSVWEYLEFIATLYDMESLTIKSNFDLLGEKLSILELQDRLIETLSKGQKQKVALIAALIHEPEILFLDEPLANLDVRAQRIVRDIIKEYKAQNRLIIIATHLLTNVQQTCDDIVIIDKGKIKYTGSVDEFKSSYENLEEAYLSFIENEVL